MRPILRIGDTPEGIRWEDFPYINFHSEGLLFSNEAGSYNAHWYDLRHPLGRYSAGDYRVVFFFKQIGRGLILVFTGKMIYP